MQAHLHFKYKHAFINASRLELRFGHRSLTTHAMPDYPAQPARSLPAPSVGGQKTDEQKPLHRLVTGAQG